MLHAPLTLTDRCFYIIEFNRQSQFELLGLRYQGMYHNMSNTIDKVNPGCSVWLFDIFSNMGYSAWLWNVE